MLADFGMEIPDGSNEGSRYELLRHGVGFWSLPIARSRAPSTCASRLGTSKGRSTEQIVQLLDQRDHLTDPSARQPIDDRIRAAVRYAEDSATLARIGAETSD